MRVQNEFDNSNDPAGVTAFVGQHRWFGVELVAIILQSIDGIPGDIEEAAMTTSIPRARAMSMTFST